MEKTLQKRIIFFTKIYFVIFTISLLIVINKMDSDESRQDMSYILACRKFDKIDMQSLKENGIIEDKIYAWLNAENKQLWKKNKAVRENLIEILIKKYGANRNEIDFIKGYSESSNKHNFNLIGIDSSFEARFHQFKEKEGEFSTVQECLAKIELFSSPFEAIILTDLDTGNLQHSIDSLYLDENNEYLDEETGEPIPIEHSRSMLFNRVQKIDQVYFDNSNFHLSVKSGARNPQNGGIACPDIPVRGSYISVRISSLIDLLKIDSDLAAELMSNQKTYDRIETIYGNLYLDDCIKLLSEENSKNFKSVSLLGFQFSRQRLPYAFLFFLMLAGIGVYSSMRKAKKENLKIVSTSNEDVLFMLVENRVLRFLLWLVIPVWVILWNYEFKISSVETLVITLIATTAIIALNLKSFLLSLKL